MPKRNSEGCPHLHMCVIFKYWKGTAPPYLNDMFMPSLNNYNTRSQIALVIRLCRRNKGQKYMSFLRPTIWNKVSSNIKRAATTSPFTHRLKKEILIKLQEQFYWYFLLLLLLLILLLFFFNFMKIDFFFLLYFFAFIPLGGP